MVSGAAPARFRLEPLTLRDLEWLRRQIHASVERARHDLEQMETLIIAVRLHARGRTRPGPAGRQRRLAS